MKSNLLTIAIPTYNRELILEEALSDLIPKISNYNLEIVICDNASTDNTKRVVEKYMAIYPHITYFRQSSNIIDKNFVTCYELASSKYIWLLGDSSRIVDIHFPKIIELLSSGELSAITMNAAGRVTDVKSKSFTDPIELLSELGWHLGLISSMIVLKAMTEKTYTHRYMETTFIHLGLFFEYLCLNGGTVLWMNETTTQPTHLNKLSTSWVPRAFEVYGKGWMCFVLSLPSQIPLNTRLKCVKDHSVKQGLFETKNLLELKRHNLLNYNQIRQYKHYLPFLTNSSLFKIFLICNTPYVVSKRFYKHYNSVRKRLI